MSQFQKVENSKANELRSFVISSNVKFWDLRKKLLFCGDYCINNENKHLLKKVDYKILSEKVFETNFNLSQIKICDEIYEKLLKDLSINLNRIHNIKWSLRSWRVFIGPWLNRYVGIINNRLNLLFHSYTLNSIEFKNINFKNDSLISYDLRDFTDKAVNHEWNEKLIRRLHHINSSEKFDLKYLSKLKLEKFIDEEKQNKIDVFADQLKKKINFLWNFFFFSKNNKFFFHKIYIGSFFTTLKLFYGLKIFPTKYFISSKRFKKNFDLSLRNKIKLDYESDNYNEKVIRFLLTELLPTVYLEGFKDMETELKKSNLPNKPIKIFTSNCSQDTIFKFWISDSINIGSRLIHGQHGAAYGMVKEHSNLKYELSISDRYLTWGWSLKKKK